MKRNLLIVEDDEQIRKMLSLYFGNRNYNILGTYDGSVLTLDNISLYRYNVADGGFYDDHRRFDVPLKRYISCQTHGM